MTQNYMAAVMPAPNKPIELREFREPNLEPGSALLHTMYSEVCGTDIHLLHGKLAGVSYPIIPGHVSVGAVAKIHEASLDFGIMPEQCLRIFARQQVSASCVSFSSAFLAASYCSNADERCLPRDDYTTGSSQAGFYCSTASRHHQPASFSRYLSRDTGRRRQHGQHSD